MTEFLQIYAQIFGFAAARFNISRYVLESVKLVKIFAAIGALLFAFNYWGLGFTEPALLCLVSVFRSGMLSLDWGMRHRYWVFLLTLVGAVGVGVQGDATLVAWLGVSAVVLQAVSEIQTSDIRLRVSLYAVACLWLTIGILSGSYGQILTSLASISLNTIGIYRHHYRKKAA